ncbi:ABC transporter ATP-binding protein [Pelagibacterium sp. 26DY04]|uniref:ABC transporter ATP-binding protein n=1 Tax=Pelagibacterium sp. 26DY04 TaxID=2967130 RepID=UPI002814FE5B|nr:ABC transporter ATP-binding protein [Pelagibacterium sp. 26DY04]WMT88432.1 ABC transporter ATP-binding protein [Pelagibacterium sp. 26DY04]
MQTDLLMSLKDVSISFVQDGRQTQALNKVSFDIPRGKTVCLVGESGCGKSLTARSILRILDNNARIDGGAITFESANGVVDLASLPDKGQQLRAIRGNEITMIFQEPMSAMSVYHTIGDQIIEGICQHSSMSKGQARARALEVLEAVGMPDAEARLDAYTFELSGGQRQRAMIAMALANNPQLLIADEPTTALDVTTQAVTLELMRDLQDRFGMSILFITHDLGVVADIADEVVVMYLGEVVERGPVEQIFNRPRHPYTRALLKAAPHYDQRHGERLPVIPGTVPALWQRPAGCVFSTRCAYFEPGSCDAIRPPMMPGETQSRCVFTADELDARKPLPVAVEAEIVPFARPPVDGTVFEAEAITKHFVKKSGLFKRKTKTIEAVSDVSLTLRGGETLGLVGESGCGKSTLGFTLAGLHEPTGGSIRLKRDGSLVDVTDISEAERRSVWRDLRIVFQDPFASLNPRMSVFDIVAEPLRAGPQPVTDRHELARRVNETLARVGLDPALGDRYPHAFSGGQRQRIGIARALVPNPRIIIADEPVSALDVSVQAQILNLFRDLQREFSLTYLFVSHDLNVVSNIADRVAVMYAGRIVELADTTDIYNRPQHPYTAALLSAVLTPEYGHKRSGRQRLRGHPPNPADLPPGCAFAARCPFATDLCRSVAPELTTDPQGRLAACHRKDELNLEGLQETA